MPLSLVTPPAEEPVTLADARSWLRDPPAQDDPQIEALIMAARQMLDGKDGMLGRSIVTQTWRLTLDQFPASIRLPLGPVQSVASITYVDATGSTQTLAADQYGLHDDEVAPAYGVSWPTARRQRDAVTVEYVAGTAVEDVDKRITTAMRMLVAQWYENREAVAVNVGNVAELPFSVQWLLEPLRRFEVV